MSFLPCTPDRFVQSGNVEFQIEAFDSGELAFNVAREQLGIFCCKFLLGSAAG